MGKKKRQAAVLPKKSQTDVATDELAKLARNGLYFMVTLGALIAGTVAANSVHESRKTAAEKRANVVREEKELVESILPKPAETAPDDANTVKVIFEEEVPQGIVKSFKKDDTDALWDDLFVFVPGTADTTKANQEKAYLTQVLGIVMSNQKGQELIEFLKGKTKLYLGMEPMSDYITYDYVTHKYNKIALSTNMMKEALENNKEYMTKIMAAGFISTLGLEKREVENQSPNNVLDPRLRAHVACLQYIEGNHRVAEALKELMGIEAPEEMAFNLGSFEKGVKEYLRYGTFKNLGDYEKIVESFGDIRLPKGTQEKIERFVDEMTENWEIENGQDGSARYTLRPIVLVAEGYERDEKNDPVSDMLTTTVTKRGIVEEDDGPYTGWYVEMTSPGTGLSRMLGRLNGEESPREVVRMSALYSLDGQLEKLRREFNDGKVEIRDFSKEEQQPVAPKNLKVGGEAKPQIKEI